MQTPHAELRELGWSDWFAQRADCGAAESFARVAAVDRDQLLLLDPTGQFRGKLSGRYRHRHPLAQERPCVGDWVGVEKQPNREFGVIHSLLPRRTSLRRKAAGKDIESQMIAANLDCVVIVQSCHFDFNLRRLERYLVMVKEGGAEPIILLTKTDLIAPAAMAAQLAEIQACGITAPVMTVSNRTREGMEDFKRLLSPGNTYCIVGSSGVGKSTLINELIGRETLETGDLSETGEGRHTTVRRELIRLDGGAWVIDNPGMREFGLLDAESGIEGNYADIKDRAVDCRFRDCRHTGESGCAVRAAVEAGEISREVFDRFLKLREEAAFNDLSHAGKRKKDRDFGRYLKSAKRDLKGDERDRRDHA